MLRSLGPKQSHSKVSPQRGGQVMDLERLTAACDDLKSGQALPGCELDLGRRLVIHSRLAGHAEVEKAEAGVGQR